MALTASTPTTVKTTAGPPRITKCATGVAAIVYNENSGTEMYGKVADVTGGSLSIGSEQTIETTAFYAAGEYDLKQAGSNKLIVVYNDGSTVAVDSGVIRVVTRSGNTLTPQTLADVTSFGDNTFDCRMAINSAGTEALVMHIYGGLGKAYSSVDVSGNTCTADTSANQSSNLDNGVAVVSMGGSKFLTMYNDSDSSPISLYFQVVDVSSGISQGTEDDSGVDITTGTFQIPRALAGLSTSKAVALMPRDLATDALSLMVVNISGTSIDSYGTIYDLYTNAGGVKSGSVDDISSTSFIALYADASSNLKAETFSISGSTISSNSDVVTIAGANWASDAQIVMVDTDKYIATWVDTSGDVKVSYITPGGVSYDLTHSAGGVPGLIRVGNQPEDATITIDSATYSPGGYGVPNRLIVTVTTTAPTYLTIAATGVATAQYLHTVNGQQVYTIDDVSASGTVTVTNYYNNSNNDTDTW